MHKFDIKTYTDRIVAFISLSQVLSHTMKHIIRQHDQSTDISYTNSSVSLENKINIENSVDTIDSNHSMNSNNIKTKKRKFNQFSPNSSSINHENNNSNSDDEHGDMPPLKRRKVSKHNNFDKNSSISLSPSSSHNFNEFETNLIPNSNNYNNNNNDNNIAIDGKINVSKLAKSDLIQKSHENRGYQTDLFINRM